MQPPAPRSAGDSTRPDFVRPNPTLGAFFYIPHDHAGPRTSPDLTYLAAYTHPPSLHSVPGAPPDFRRPHVAFRPDTCIGPVVGVDHTPRCTAVLIAGYWVIIWRSRYWVDYHRLAGPTIFPITWQGVLQYCTQRGLPRPLVRWHHPFPELARFASRLGVSHYTEPDGATPPRFLLTGHSWFRLADAAARLRRSVPNHASALPIYIAEDLSWSLHPRLDYPAVHGPTIHPNGYDTTTYLDLDIRPRNVVHSLLRRWVRARRAHRTASRAAVLKGDGALPDVILAVPHLVTWVAAFLG